jgi:uncharacterized protein YbaR (Trm112 family)
MENSTLNDAANNAEDKPIPSWLACPLCRGPLSQVEDDFYCPEHDLVFPAREGILRLLPPPEREAAADFAAEYRRRREEQGWRPLSAEEISALPETAPSGWDRLYWPTRAQSFRVLSKRIKALAAQEDRPLRIVDMGAGIAWLGGCCAAAGHTVVALDLSCDEAFGLGAARSISQSSGRALTLVQGDMEQPPFLPQSADLLIYNASLHYAGDLGRCLMAGAQTLRPEGALIIMDSPVVYGSVTAVPTEADRGQSWRRGRQLSEEELAQALAQAGLRSKTLPVRRGFRWRLSRLRMRLMGLAPFDLPLIYSRLG